MKAQTCEECGHMDGRSGCNMDGACPKTDEVTAISATLALDSSLYRDSSDEFPVCPKCGDQLVPARLTMDKVQTGGARGVTQHYSERQISEMTVWFCNMSCDMTEIYKADIGPSISKMTGRPV